MAKTPTEDAPRFLLELAEALEQDTLEDYAVEWLDSPVARRQGAAKLRTAAEAMQILWRLGEYIAEHNV